MSPDTHEHAHSFDDRAATWDDDAKVERSQKIASVIRQAIPLDPSMRLLEYGAGTGLITQALRDAVGPVVLVDTSTGMRQVMHDKIAAGALPDAEVWDVDLSVESVDAEFDVIVSVMAMHHVGDIDAALANFAGLLGEGGHLGIVDLEAEDGSFHGGDFDGHHGFDRATFAAQLDTAGFGEVSFRRCYDVDRGDAVFPLFLATAVRRPDGARG